MRIFRDFTFDAAHRLDHLPVGHKCARLHGHTYRLTITLEGELQQPIGWVRDFAEIKQLVNDHALDHLDHSTLNDVPGLEQPTTEHIAMWIWDRLSPHLPELAEVKLWENANSGAVYAGTR